MKTALRSLLGGLMLVIAFTSYGYGLKMEGTYTNTSGIITLDLRSGGKAAVTLMGDNYACTYKVKGNKLLVDCTPKGEKLDFTIHDDGSLSGPAFIGSMKKSK